MTRTFTAFFATLAVSYFVFSAALAANSIRVTGRAYTDGCAYYTTQTADLNVTYENLDLSWGTKVELLYGWGGTTFASRDGRLVDVPLTWQYTKTVEVRARSPWTWSADVTGTIAERSSPTRFTDLDFVLRVTRPDGSVFFEKGNGSGENGFYRVTFLGDRAPACVPGGGPYPEMKPLKLEAVP